MDPLTHGLASYALKRALFPRIPRLTTGFVIAAGVLADTDWLSYYSGPSAFLSWHRTWTHSLFLTTIISLLLSAAAFVITRKRGLPTAPLGILFATVSAGLLHLAMDACQSAGVALLWPFRPGRIALDWLPNFDPWILAVLIVAILLPELLLLVTSEIGAKSRRPRGRNGALVGLAFLLMYIGSRQFLHARAAVTLETATFSGESPLRVAAFPDSASLFTWHAVVETQSALRLADVSVAPGAYFNPDAAIALHKPENSPVLAAAQATPAAAQFLRVARFPKATIQHETAGFSIEIVDLRYLAMLQSVGAVEVNANLDLAGKVTFSSIEWQKEPSRR